jgi:hypothetical protein
MLILHKNVTTQWVTIRSITSCSAWLHQIFFHFSPGEGEACKHYLCTLKRRLGGPGEPPEMMDVLQATKTNPSTTYLWTSLTSQSELTRLFRGDGLTEKEK